MDNRKNTILLTVIAVATLLVAVVGATFAYFTAQGGAGDQADVNVQTETTSSTAMVVNGSIFLHATPDNFDTAETSHLNSETDAYATVTWRPSTAEGTDPDFCYTVTLNITEMILNMIQLMLKMTFLNYYSISKNLLQIFLVILKFKPQ